MKHREILDFQGHESRAFPDFPWRRIETWRYVLLDPSATADEVLEALLRDQHYAYSFTSPYPEGRRLPPVRGPYLLESLTPDSFLPITVEEAWSQLDQFLSDWDPPPTRVDLELESLIGQSLETGDEVFQLREDQSKHSEYSFLVSEYGECVVIDRDAKLVLDVAHAVD
jgi:hypothetical protein